MQCEDSQAVCHTHRSPGCGRVRLFCHIKQCLGWLAEPGGGIQRHRPQCL